MKSDCVKKTYVSDWFPMGGEHELHRPNQLQDKVYNRQRQVGKGLVTQACTSSEACPTEEHRHQVPQRCNTRQALRCNIGATTAVSTRRSSMPKPPRSMSFGDLVVKLQEDAHGILKPPLAGKLSPPLAERGLAEPVLNELAGTEASFT